MFHTVDKTKYDAGSRWEFKEHPMFGATKVWGLRVPVSRWQIWISDFSASLRDVPSCQETKGMFSIGSLSSHCITQMYFQQEVSGYAIASQDVETGPAAGKVSLKSFSRSNWCRQILGCLIHIRAPANNNKKYYYKSKDSWIGLASIPFFTSLPISQTDNWELLVSWMALESVFPPFCYHSTP